MNDFLNSLDPRINRLNIPDNFDSSFPEKEGKDQFITYEVFVQPKSDKLYQHEGIVHAPTADMAFLFAKEQYSRRGFSCTGIWTIKTNHLQVSPYTENKEDIYDYIHQEMLEEAEKGELENYTIFHLNKRGKQHKFEGNVQATCFEEALFKAKQAFQSEKAVLNIWVVKTDNIFKIEGGDFADIWDTLPEKKYRDAIDYKATEKIKKFKEEQNS